MLLCCDTPLGFNSPAAKKQRSRTEDTEEASRAEIATSPIRTPEQAFHPDYNMSAFRAQKLLELCRRSKATDPERLKLSTRPKMLAVIKRKLINQLRVPTASNPSYHLYRELDLLTAQAARSAFFDLKQIGPFLRGKSVYHNYETDSCEMMKKWFALEERRGNGMGQAMMRSHGQVLVMARPPFLIEHQTHDEAEGIRMTAGILTLNCRGVARFAPPPAPEMDTPEQAAKRQQLADKDLDFAWSLVKLLAERETCRLDHHWYEELAERFGRRWLSYLSDREGSDSESSVQKLEENSDSEAED